MNKNLVIYRDDNNLYYGNQEQNNIEIVSMEDVEPESNIPNNNLKNNTYSDYLEDEAKFLDVIFYLLLFFLLVQCFMKLYLYLKSYNTRTQLQITLNDNYNFNRIILKDEFDNDTCSICLDELYSNENQDEIIQIKCNHMFHKKCLDEWILQKKICPLCKVEL
jgi:hypothetical protein